MSVHDVPSITARLPGGDYDQGVTDHPAEHPLELSRSHLVELAEGLAGMSGTPDLEVHDDVIIDPL